MACHVTTGPPGGSLAPVLRQLEVPVLTNSRCEALYRRAGRPQYIPDIFMCAGYSQVPRLNFMMKNAFIKRGCQAATQCDP